MDEDISFAITFIIGSILLLIGLLAYITEMNPGIESTKVYYIVAGLLLMIISAPRIRNIRITL